MPLSKSDIERKREKRRAKKEKIDKLTNWYMINLSWGVLGFIAFSFVENLFGSAETVLKAPMIMKILGIVFIVLGVLLFVLGKTNVIKNTKRANDYAIFMGVVALISLIIGFYSNIRNVVIGILPQAAALRSEWWYCWGFRYLLAAYLIIGFIVVTIKTALAAKGK